jgi:hypothetical protein
LFFIESNEENETPIDAIGRLRSKTEIGLKLMVQSQYVIFITRKETCPSIILNILKIPQAEDAKYLGLHLGRLNGKECVLTK